MTVRLAHQSLNTVAVHRYFKRAGTYTDAALEYNFAAEIRVFFQRIEDRFAG